MEIKNYLEDLLQTIGFNDFEIEIQENPEERFVRFMEIGRAHV